MRHVELGKVIARGAGYMDLGIPVANAQACFIDMQDLGVKQRFFNGAHVGPKGFLPTFDQVDERSGADRAPIPLFDHLAQPLIRDP